MAENGSFALRGTFTEQEARNQFCPFIRRMHMVEIEQRNAGVIGATATARVPAPGAFNQWPNDHNPSDMNYATCMASGCMAWRWHSNDHGYCGIAGEPKDDTLGGSRH